MKAVTGAHVCVRTVTAWDSEDRPKYLRILFVCLVISLQNLQKYHDRRNNWLYGMHVCRVLARDAKT